jgi:hypothetical protein
MVLGIVLPLGWQLGDRRRLPREGRDRSWNLASWGAALYAFGPLSMLGWFVVTRRGWRRLLGVPAFLAVAAVVTLVDALLELLLGG